MTDVREAAQRIAEEADKGASPMDFLDLALGPSPSLLESIGLDAGQAGAIQSKTMEILERDRSRFLEQMVRNERKSNPSRGVEAYDIDYDESAYQTALQSLESDLSALAGPKKANLLIKHLHAGASLGKLGTRDVELVVIRGAPNDNPSGARSAIRIETREYDPRTGVKTGGWTGSPESLKEMYGITLDSIKAAE